MPCGRVPTLIRDYPVTEIIAIASDHAGVALKALLAADLEEHGFDVIDLGTNGPDPVDYPDFAEAMLSTVSLRNSVTKESTFLNII